MSTTKWFCMKDKKLYDEDPKLPSSYRWETIPKVGEGIYFCFPEGLVELRKNELTGNSLIARKDLKKGELFWHYDIGKRHSDLVFFSNLF